jgi:uroporphyrinogen-III decarboxylase
MFVNLLADMNIEIIKRYAELGIDGVINCDDWGLQNSLMISPDAWREIWKPAYKRVYDAAHTAGMDTWLHSCGYIIDIIDDLIDVGLNALHMDQQQNMGLDNLKCFRGRITFFAPADTQKIMPNGNPDEIRGYCRKMSECLGTKSGGFIPRWYTDPKGVGHSRESIEIMCNEFLAISREIYGATP